MKVIEVHILQNVAPANLNRDDTGSPKSAMFGGYRRARVSSQSQKRAVREAFKGLLPQDNLATRTKKLLGELVGRLVERGVAEPQAEGVAQVLLEGVGLGVKNKATEYLLFIGNQEIDRIAEVAHDHLEELLELVGQDAEEESGRKKKEAAKAKLPAEVKKELEKVFDGGKAVDLALFGRMLADRPEWNVDAASQVAHAISTHKVDREFDFYTAVDDLNPKEETGAGMMGDVEYYSATLYRYANVNLEKLVENLHGDKELAAEGIRAFLRAFVETLPSGKQNTFAAHNPPDFVAIFVRDGAPRNLANAFVNPVWRSKTDLVSASVEALDSYASKVESVYGDTRASAYYLNLSAASPENVGEAADGLNEAIESTMLHVEEWLEAM
ncbi:type I-E CRISPR-associated protein Cas7/Cse4/CasC [Oceanithermus sp.]